MKQIKMKFTALLFLMIAQVFGQQPFTVHILPSQITAVRPMHSGAVAIHNGKWIFIGGRRDGIHIMQAGMAFDETFRNDSIFIVDPVSNTIATAGMQQLQQQIYSAASSSNMQYYQDGNRLYMIGGYGKDDNTFTWITFPSLIRVDLDSLVADVTNNLPISNCFTQYIDSNLAVTGGALEKFDSTYYLVFGHNFRGRYSKQNLGLFTQHYTTEIRKFNILDSAGVLSVTNYTAVSDTDLFHRRDFNFIPQIFPDHERGFTVFGGVFQKNADQPYLTPIDITKDSIHHISGFNENLNQYSTASMPVYDSLNNAMHTIFFGGISLYTLDTVSGNLVQDTLVPFVSTISMITRDSLGNLTESKIQENMPALKGTNAVFIPVAGVPVIDGKFIDVNSLSGNTLVGYLVGGIHSDLPNIADLDPVGGSRANSIVYEVYIDKTVNSVPEIPIVNHINNLSVYPNPAHGLFNVDFDLAKEQICDISIFDSANSLVKIFLNGKKLSGSQHLSFSTDGIGKGIYMCHVKAGNTEKILKVVFE
jgi:hypothetical protein